MTNTPDKPGRQKETQRIRDFLEKPTHNGSVLLVSGERGSGKTYLVDTALADEPHKEHPFWYSLFGDRPLRKKRSVCRKPREHLRHIIPVPVDPFFPHNGETTKADKDGKISTEAESPRQALIRNVIFALTSTLDPRISIRRHGRTLRERLGWFDYWFSPAALWGMGKGKGISFWLAMAYTVPVLFVSFVIPLFTYLLPDNIPLAIALAIPGSITLPVLSWVLLRYWDWRLLAKHSGRLYDLIHADAATQSVHSDRLLKMAYDGKMDNAGGALKALLISAIAGLGFWQTTTDQQSANPSHTVLAVLVGLLAGTLTYSYSLNKQHNWHRDFGTRNPAWRVTLLRRYLHILHRCGIEPVLVVDELDKLDKTFFDDGAATAAGNTPNQDISTFLTAFAQLKQSLGTHFFWILIDEQRILNEVLKDRNRVPQGAAATLVQDIITIGPIPFTEAQYHIGENQKKDAAYRWIHAGGLYAGIRDGYLELDEDMIKLYINRSGRLAKEVDELWSLDSPTITPLFHYNPHALARLKHHWHVHLIRRGMLAFAKKLLHWETRHPQEPPSLDGYLSRMDADPFATLEEHLLPNGTQDLAKYSELGESILWFHLSNIRVTTRGSRETFIQTNAETKRTALSAWVDEKED